jgi:hypothetical protein
MKLSKLQKYILKHCFETRDNRVSKSKIFAFYNKKKKKPQLKDIITIVTKSVERLIRKELIVGYGYKTAHKWFIREVKLTPKGKKIAKALFGTQQKLPLKMRRKK